MNMRALARKGRRLMSQNAEMPEVAVEPTAEVSAEAREETSKEAREDESEEPSEAAADVGDEAQPEQDAENLPGVSVIVYAHNREQSIREFLDSLLHQDYPEYEVIVINDASIDNTAEIVDTLMESEPRLRYSFVPDSSRNVSRRKVAFTIGAKSAKYPVLLICSAASEIPSNRWLRQMAEPFEDPQVEFSLGVSVYPASRQKGAGRWYRQFDQLLRDSQWIGSALRGVPFRGDAYALAFRRQSFFDRKGFADTNRFVGGEDDIYVNQQAIRQNTRLVLSPQTLVIQDLPEDEYPRLWRRSKERYTFTQGYLDTWAYRLQASLGIALWTGFGCGLAGSILALPNLAPACIALLVTLLLWAYEICLYRRAAALLQSVRLFWSVPLFWMMRPLINSVYRIRFRANKASNYTWKHSK